MLLLDEPFSALDLLTREAFDTELERLWMERRPTLLLVTHSVAEAVLLADRIVVLGARPGTVVADLAVPLAHPRGTDVMAQPPARAVAAAIRDALSRAHDPDLAGWVAS